MQISHIDHRQFKRKKSDIGNKLDLGIKTLRVNPAKVNPVSRSKRLSWFSKSACFRWLQKSRPLCHEIKVADPERLRFDVRCGYFNHLSPSMTSHCWLRAPHTYPEPAGPFQPILIHWWPCSAGTGTGVSPLL